MEDEIDLLDARPAYRLDLYEGKIYAAPGKKQKIHLKWGEMAAFLLTNDVVETDEEKKECAWALLLERFTLNRVKQFEITPAGMKAKMIEEEAQPVALGADWTERYGWEFSGEAVYHCKVELPEEPKPDDEYELDLGEVKYTADVRVNGMAAGVSALSPHIVRLKGEQLKKQCEIEIRVANTAANQCVSADIRAYWPERFVGPYHETQKVFEREMLDGGLAGPVILRKMK